MMFRTLRYVLCVFALFGAGSGFFFSSPGLAQAKEEILPRPQEVISGGPLSQKPVSVDVMIELTDQPTTVVYANELARGASMGPSISKARAISTAQIELNRIDSIQITMLTLLTAPEINATPIYRVQRVYNGIAVQVDAGKLDQIRKMPGVKAVHRLIPKFLDNASSVPLIGAPYAWIAGSGNRGEGIKIGIIDTGIDYLHTDFGGPGTGYATNDPTIIGDTPGYFPSGPKVIGGYDFAGDDYNADDPTKSIPKPDPDPMDCNGHGSHVAGTVAGYGVNGDGSTYTGSYDTSTPFGSLRIGPGVAPKASLYALRIFGCSGSTNLTTQAIEWAVDPNKDGSFSDHLDVINMSLGSDFGAAYDTDAVASDHAALAGVIVVISAGNSGDTFYVVGSPGTSGQAITVASSVDSTDILDGFRVNSPGEIAGVYPSSHSVNFNWASMTPVTGALVYPPTQKSGCTAFDAGDRSVISGNIVLLDWTDSECGSTTRTNNAADAGARGVILAYNHPILDITISGSNRIPTTITTQATGDILKPYVASGVNVTLSNEYIASRKYVDNSRTDTLSSFSSRGPRRGSMLKPDVSAPGQGIFSVRALSGNAGESLNGTSMAAPHITGAMALLRELHPTWTVEELKALLMNTATHDLYSGLSHTGQKYGVSRVGAGRVDLQNASAAQAIAYNSDDPGLVSISFGAPEVAGTGTVTQSKTVRVINKGTSSVSYSIGYTGITDVPGVNFSFAGVTTVIVPGGGSQSFTVQMSADAGSMRHTHDATVSETQGGYPRHWLSEKSGYITLTPTSGPVLRVPVYAAPRPASTMTTAESWIKLDPPTGTVNLDLTGQGVSTGTSFPTDEVSLVSALELQEISPRDAPLSLSDTPFHNADLKYIGVTSDYKAKGTISATTIFFGIGSYGDWSTPNEVEFDIYIDKNRDGTYDYALFNWDYGSASGTDPTDTFLSLLCPLPSGTCYWWYLNGIPGSGGSAPRDTVPFNNNVMVLPVSASSIGLADGSSKFNYFVVSFSRDQDGQVDISDVHTYDPAHPGLSFGGTSYAGSPVLQPLYKDLEGQTIQVDYNWNNYFAGGSKGLLLLHHHNTAGNRAQVVDVAHHALVKPKEGTLGTEILITGDGFGSKKGKVLVGGAALKNVGWTNTSISGVLGKVMSSGMYPLTIVAKGVTSIVEEGGFTVKGPSIVEIVPAVGAVGDPIVIHGSFFGTNKGKVLIGSKSCKVVSWTMDSKTGDSTVQFLVPKGLTGGATHNVTVVTKMGSAVLSKGFTIE